MFQHLTNELAKWVHKYQIRNYYKTKENKQAMIHTNTIHRKTWSTNMDDNIKIEKMRSSNMDDKTNSFIVECGIDPFYVCIFNGA